MAIPRVFTLPRQTAFNVGVIASGAKAYFFKAGTTTPQDTYTTADLTTQHAHPVEANAAGLFPIIYLDDELQYRVQVKTSADVLIYDQDEINDPNNRAPFYPRTQAEIDAGVTPSDTQYSGDTHDYDVRRLGFSTAAAAADNTTALNNAWTVVSGAGGGTIRIEPGSYGTVSVNWSDANDGWVEIVAYGATFTRSATTSPYTMLSHRKNVRIYGLTLKGYIDSGTGFGTVVPNDGYGFRPDGTQAQDGDVEYIDCVADGLSYDGWYIDAANCRARLVGCDGHDNVRNDLAFVNGQSATIDGGEWGNDAQVLTKNACIDIEPDAGKSARFASVKNVRAFHKVSFYGAAGAGLIEVGEIDDIIFDGDVYGSTCGLRWYRVDEMRIGRYEEINSATLQQAGDPESADDQARGAFRFLNTKAFNRNHQTKNLLVGPYNTFTGWTSSIGGGTTATPNVDCYGFKGLRLDNAATSSISYSQDVTVSLSEDTWFTFGGLIRLVDAIGGNRQGIRVTFGGDSYYLAGDGYVAAAIKVPQAITTINFYFGTADSLNFDMVFSRMFLFEGLGHPFYSPTTMYWSAAPTSGTWAVLDKVYNSAPSASGNIGWVCVSAGTPGTWIPFGSTQSADAWTDGGAHSTLRDTTGTSTAADALQLVETLIADLKSSGTLK